MPKFVPYVIVVGLFLAVLFLIQIRDRSYLENIARTSYPPPQASRVILPPPPEQVGPNLYVNGDRVAFRSGPGLQQPVLERFNKGHKTRQIDVQGDWVHVRDAGTGREGWIAGRYLVPVDPLEKTASN